MPRPIAPKGAFTPATDPLPERLVTLGTDLDSGNPFRLPFEAWKKGVTTVGSIGAGKTSAWRRFLYRFGLQVNFLHLDYAGTGHRFFLHWIALVGSVLSWMEQTYDHVPRGLTHRFLSRFAFLTIDGTGLNPVRFDLLKRRYLPALGRFEPISDVVHRVLLAKDMTFNEEQGQLRVQFRRVARPMLTLLVAAGRPISEIVHLLDRRDDYYAFLKQAIDAATMYYDADRRILTHAFASTDDLRRLPEREYRAETLSTRNAFDDYLDGQLLGMLFSEETFPIEELAFGNRCLSIASTITDPITRAQCYQMILALFQSTVEGRVADRTVCVLSDEIGHLARRHQDTIARSRNFGVSYFHAYQGDDQWKSIGMPEMPKLIRKFAGLDIRFRPTYFDEAKEMAYHTRIFDPGDVFVRMLTNGTSLARGITTTLTDSWNETMSASNSWNSSDAREWSEGAGTQEGESRRGFDAEGEDVTRSASMSRSAGTSEKHASGSAGGTGTASSTGGSRARGTSRTESETVQEVLFRVGCEEQAFMEAQKILHTADRIAYVSTGGATHRVKMLPAAELPPDLLGVPIAENLQRWHDDYWSSRAKRRTPFAPSITITTATATATAMQAALPARHIPEHAFPPADLEREGEPRRMALLRLIATVRLCTVTLLIAVTHWSYDKCYRELDRLLADGLLDRVKPYAPRGEGSAPIIYILNANGARALGDTGAGDFDRIAKNLAVFRRTVEANRPVQMAHRMWSTLLATHVVSAVCAAAPTTYATDVRFDRERTFSVDLSPFTIPPRHRSLISPNPTLTTVTYVPDFFLQLHRERDGTVVRDIVIGEVETGFGERSAKDLAIGKSWKIRVLMASIASTGKIGNIVLDPGAQVRVVVWCRTAAIEQGFFDGAAEVFEGVKSPFWIASGDRVPLTIPPGTKKKDVSGAVRRLVDAVQDRVWRWLRFPDPTDRRRFVATGD